MNNLSHHKTEVNGIKIHYVTAGEGPLIILLHGFPEFWYSWRNQLEDLSANYKVVAPDLRGYGESDKPKGVKNYHIDLIASDITGLINKLGHEKAIIVGHDWGGAVAWKLATSYKDYVEKLIILNCPPVEILFKSLFTNFRQFRRSWYIYFFQIPSLPEKRIHANLKEFFLRGLKGWSINENCFYRSGYRQVCAGV